MPERDDRELTVEERRLEERLSDLGPVMGAAARSRAEAPDPAFLMALRARLVEPEPKAPDRSFQRRLRGRLVGKRPGFPWRLAMPVGAVAAAVLVVLVVLHPFNRPPEQRHLAAGIPRPTKQDLIRGYPPLGVSGGGGGYLTPMVSRVGGPPGNAYPKRLDLAAGSFPSMPGALPYYRLAKQPFGGTSITEIAHHLGIGGRAVCMSPVTAKQAPCSRQTWTVVAQHLFPSRQPLHSLAVSSSGQVIYHDVSYNQLAYHGPALPHHRAVALARAWLVKLGWPASRAPVLSVEPAKTAGPLNAGLPVEVSFAWNNGVRGPVPAATLWVAPTGTVVEALLWPPVVRHRVVAARDVGDAWTQVQSGKAPAAVLGGVLVPVPGKGTVSKVTVVQVLVTSRRGPAFLEPAYKFSGTVTLNGERRTRSWYALVPASS